MAISTTLNSILEFIGYGLPPVGAIEMYAGTTAPSGWLKCDGSAVSRTTYPKLFDAIDTTYGAGDGSTTFNLPNLTDKVPIGAGSTYALAASGGSETATVPTHKLTTSEIPAHTHGEASITGSVDLRASDAGSLVMDRSGKFTVGTDSSTANNVANSGTYSKRSTLTYNATHTHTSVGGSGSHGHGSVSTIQPYLALNYIIRAT